MRLTVTSNQARSQTEPGRYSHEALLVPAPHSGYGTYVSRRPVSQFIPGLGVISVIDNSFAVETLGLPQQEKP